MGSGSESSLSCLADINLSLSFTKRGSVGNRGGVAFSSSRSSSTLLFSEVERDCGDLFDGMFSNEEGTVISIGSSSGKVSTEISSSSPLEERVADSDSAKRQTKKGLIFSFHIKVSPDPIGIKIRELKLKIEHQAMIYRGTGIVVRGTRGASLISNPLGNYSEIPG